MKQMLLGLVPVVTVAMMVSGCEVFDDDDDAPPPQPVQFDLRVLHASPDAPPVNVLVDGSSTLTDVDYKQGSGFLSLDEGTYSIQVDGLLPDGAATVIGPVDLDFVGDTEYSVLAVGPVASIETLVIENPASTVSAGSARAQVVHAAPQAPRVDVFITSPGADLTTEAPLGSVSFMESLGPSEVAAGDYQVRIAVENQPTQVVFDSGTINLSEGADLQVVAVENTGHGSALISLLAWDASGVAEILDVSTPADLRVVHASPDAPAVDVIVNDDFANPLVPALEFPTFEPETGYVSVPTDTYNVKVTDSATQGLIAIDEDLQLEAGQQYTVIAVGSLAAIEPLVLIDNNRDIATQAKVRIVHASPTAGNVDIYVTPPDADISGLDPSFADVPFQEQTGYVNLAAGEYDVLVTPTGTEDIAIGPARISVSDSGVYTAIARDAVGGGAPLGLILLDDF